MKKMTIKDIIDFTNGTLFCGDINSVIDNISTNSRTIKSGELFIPLIGEKFDGHNFMEDAYQKGCRLFICDENHKFTHDDITCVTVRDTTVSYEDISEGYRKFFNIPIIGITGSFGKTSAKDMIYGVLNNKYKTLKTLENYNNNIGISTTLLNLDESYKFGIIEMAMDRPLEMTRNSEIVCPNISVVTNIGKCHIEYFPGGQEEIFKNKMNICDYMDKDGLLIVNGDDSYLKTVKDLNYPFEIIYCGFNSYNDMYCDKYEYVNDGIFFDVVYKNKRHNFFIKTIAKHNILNAMFAIAIAFKYGFTDEEINKGLLNFSLSSNRLDIFDTPSYKVINDTYNATTESMISALEVLSHFNTRKVAILGDILELGSYSESEHRKVGDNITSDVLITVGESSKYIGLQAISNGFDKNNYYHFNSKSDLFKEIDTILNNGDTILLKSSHAIGLGEVSDYLKDK